MRSASGRLHGGSGRGLGLFDAGYGLAHQQMRPARLARSGVAIQADHEAQFRQMMERGFHGGQIVELVQAVGAIRAVRRQFAGRAAGAGTSGGFAAAEVELFGEPLGVFGYTDIAASEAHGKALGRRPSSASSTVDSS